MLHKKISKFLFLFSFLLLILNVLSIYHFYLSLKIEEVKADQSSWLTDWKYRKSHVINAASGAGTNYQVKIKVHYKTEFQFDEKWDSDYLGASSSPDFARNVIADGNYLYGVSRTPAKLVIYDISSIDSPVQKSLTSLATDGAVDVRKKGNYLFISNSGGVAVIDVSDPESPSLVKQHNLGGAVHGMFLDGNYLYCCMHWVNAFVIVDVTNPTNPVTRGQLLGTTYFHGAHDVHVDGNYAYVTNYLAGSGEYGITVVNVSDKNNPSVVTGVDENYKHSHIAKREKYIFVGAHQPSYGLTIYDVENPNSPVLVGRFFTDRLNYAYWMDWWEGYLVTANHVSLTIDLIDIADVYNPRIIDSVLMSNFETRNVYVHSNRVFATTTNIMGDTYYWKIKSFELISSSSFGENVYLDEKCRPDFGDIRFTDDNGVTLLDYWMEEKVDEDYAIFWVEVADDLSSNNATIYVYYGKSDATTTSNGDNTFLFFDDFPGTTYDSNKWQVVGSPTITVSDGELKIQRDSYSGSWSVHGLRSKTFTADEKRVIVKFKTNTFTDAACPRADADYYSRGRADKAVLQGSSRDAYISCDRRDVGGGLSKSIMLSRASADTYYKFYATRMGSSYFKCWLNGQYQATVTSNVNDGSTYIGLFIEEWGSHGTVTGTYDWVAVAKYVDPEPAHGSWGSEEIFVANATPIISEFQCPSIIYPNKYFYLNATINDPDGIADFANATVELSDSVIVKWVSETNTFSVQSDPNGYCTLDIFGSLRTTINSTACRLSWRIKLNWAYPEGYKSILSSNTKVFDIQSASGSNSHANLFYFEDDLIVHNASVDDSRINPGQTITFSGNLYYQDTLMPPEDTSGINVKVDLEAISKGSTTTIGADGAFSLSFAGETTIGSYSYTVYAVTDEPSVLNQTVNVKVDKIIITFEADKKNPANGEIVTFTVSPTYESDNEFVASFVYNINRNGTLFKSDSSSSTFTDSASGITYVYDLLDFVDLSNGILTWVDPPDLIVKWSENISSRYIVIDQAFASDERANIGSIQIIGFHARWDNGSDVIQGSIYVNGTEYTTNSTGWISFTLTSFLVGKQEWTITDVSCGGVTTYTQTTQNPRIIWDQIQIINGGTTKETLMLGETVTIWFQAKYDYDNQIFDHTNGILYVNDTQMYWSTTNNRWEYNYTPTTLGTKTFFISGVLDNSYELTVINDVTGAQTINVWSFPFSIISNSTVTELAFNSTSKVLSFTVSGPKGTIGYANVTITKTLIQNITSLRVYIDENETDYTVIDMGYSWLLHFTYNHSKHKIVIILNSSHSAQLIETPFRIATVFTIIALAILVTTMIVWMKRTFSKIKIDRLV